MDGTSAAIIVGTMALGAWAGVLLARYKGRPEAAFSWGVWGALIAICVTFLPFRKRAPGSVPTNSALTILVTSAAIAAVWINIGAVCWNWYYTGGEALPTCQSPGVKDVAQQAIASAGVGQFLGLKLLDLYNINQISATDSDRHCRATGLFSNGNEVPLSVRVFTRQGASSYFVAVQLIQ